MSRVAITTDRFHRAAPHYARAGLEPLPLPSIRPEPLGPEALERARQAASQSRLTLITSPRVVELLWPRGGMAGIEVGAVGAVTAAAVTSAGGRLVVTGTGGLGRLIDLADGRLEGDGLVVLHAAGTDPGLIERIRARASGLDEHVVYRVVPVGPAPIPVEAVAFASPSAVSGWLLTRELGETVVGAIGETTAYAVARHRPPDVIAPEPSHSALARAIASFLEVNV
jgi:uroporphyrinogen-III synthase